MGFRGLRCIPRHNPGKGIYFADMFAKSRGYTAAGSGEAAYMLLCDVALGHLGEFTQPCQRSLIIRIMTNIILGVPY